jgi:amino-acid N-acetyltransferase
VANKWQILFLDVLKSTSSKREAKSYLSRFDAHGAKKHIIKHNQESTQDVLHVKPCGVNLGLLFPSATAVTQSPVFDQEPGKQTFVDVTTQPLHAALVVIKSPKLLSDGDLQGIGLTLSYLAKLGMSCVTVVDPSKAHLANCSPEEQPKLKQHVLEQVDRVVAGIDQHGKPGARRLDNIIGISLQESLHSSTAKVIGGLRVIHPNLLLTPLQRGVIPVIAPIGYTPQGRNILVSADETVLALTRELAGIARTYSQESEPERAGKMISLDRIIILDPLGGIPSTERPNGSHIFINLEQEYNDIRRELLGNKRTTPHCPTDQQLCGQLGQLPTASDHQSVKTDDCELLNASSQIPDLEPTTSESHLSSLQLARDTVALLPPSSSALITTPHSASSYPHLPTSTTPGVGTRPHRNILIHNLLTDKPLLSSSLPTSRLSTNTPARPTTFLKRGMPLTILPSPRSTPWHPDNPRLALSDPRIDLPRLIHLIEDSFSRKLDAQHYINRISQNLAGIIIAGAYEGCAILTYETPFNLPPSLVPGTPEHTARLVPYLDKFAVLKKSQGTGGVADIVFSAMVRECFASGVVWRSRRDNPVNRWYFERARGTWKIPVKEGPQGWTMFWTTEEVSAERFGDYESVCRGVGTSWSDGMKVLD